MNTARPRTCARWLGMTLLLLGPVATAAPPTDLQAQAPIYGGGLDMILTWTPPPDDLIGYMLLRGTTASGPWKAIEPIASDAIRHKARVVSDPRREDVPETVFFRLVALRADSPIPALVPGEASDAAAAESEARYVDSLLATGDVSAPVEGRTRAYLVNLTPSRVMLALIIIVAGVLIGVFTRAARRGAELYIRRIPGIDAIEEGIGRATEMGRPVLYVPGIGELQEMQTIAAMLILGQVSKKVAEYQADMIVSCCIPIVREVADEVVKAGFYQAGYPDAYKPANTRFISSDQFAFTAGTNGIVLREKPATNLYMGMFFAESLILAETGFLNKSIQIAGTAEATQLPFFVTACDYTLIGEELYAVSAYLSRDPRLVSSLKSSDYIKVFCVVMLIIGTIAASLGNPLISTLFRIAE